MAIVYVTGLSGTGKSAVREELRARGHRGRGVDEEGYADWVNRATGMIDKFPHHDPELDIHAWYHDHDWVLSPRRIDALSRAAARRGELVFLCGSADGDAVVWHRFDAVVALVADLDTIRARIARRDNDYGKQPEEFAAILKWHHGYADAYRRRGATIVDATRPLSEVVAEVLAVARRCG